MLDEIIVEIASRFNSVTFSEGCILCASSEVFPIWGIIMDEKELSYKVISFHGDVFTACFSDEVDMITSLDSHLETYFETFQHKKV